jgi:hypothetical protein
MDNRLLQKLAKKREGQGEAERKTGVYTTLHEDSSTASTQQFTAPVESPKKSNGLFEIVVLRPTTVFLSFLTSQLLEENVPDLRCLHTDNTAYVIKKKDTQEATLDELERLYIKMFRHEICRWLGKEARNEIEKSFIDFLCCFRLEFHSHFILFEPSIHHAQQIVQLKPRVRLLQWLNSMVEHQPDLAAVMEQVTLACLTENATVLVKNFEKLTQIKPFLRTYYPYLVETAMSRMSNKPQQWPKIHSFEEFGQFFKVEIHTQLISYTS